MAISGMNHFTVLTDDVPGTVRFCAELVGLVEGPRPAFDFPGARVELDFPAGETGPTQ